jgi:peptidyl-prolyl cis-trans isomerase-like 1
MAVYGTGKHTIFGRVFAGMEVIKRLGNVQTDKSDRWDHLLTPFLI